MFFRLQVLVHAWVGHFGTKSCDFFIRIFPAWCHFSCTYITRKFTLKYLWHVTRYVLFDFGKLMICIEWNLHMYEVFKGYNLCNKHWLYGRKKKVHLGKVVTEIEKKKFPRSSFRNYVIDLNRKKSWKSKRQIQNLLILNSYNENNILFGFHCIYSNYKIKIVKYWCWRTTFESILQSKLQKRLYSNYWICQKMIYICVWFVYLARFEYSVQH